MAALGRPYRFQHIQGRYIIDFALVDDMVAIEVDGKDHNEPKKRAYDAERTAWLEEKGWRVVRCTNDEALKDPVNTVNRLMEQANLTYRVKD